MIDPLVESHLFLMLTHQGYDRVTIEDVCWFHSGRALRVIREAGLKPDVHGAFVPTEASVAWIHRVFKEIRYVDPNLQLDVTARDSEYVPSESTAAEEELPAPAPRPAARAAGEIAWGEPTPIGGHPALIA